MADRSTISARSGLTQILRRQEQAHIRGIEGRCTARNDVV
jgi:hypothetical protein